MGARIYYLSAFCLMLFCIVFSLKLVFSYQNADNVLPVYVKVSGLVAHSDSVGIISPSGSYKQYKPLLPTIWCKPDDERNAVTSIVVSKRVPLDTLQIWYTFDDNLLQWSPCSAAEIIENDSCYIASPISIAKGSLISYYSSAINWKGDFWLIFIPLAESLVLCLLFVFLYLKRRYVIIGSKMMLRVLRKDSFLFLWLIPVLLISFYLNNRFNTPFELSFRHPDEWTITSNFMKFQKGFWDSYYGLQYNFLQLIFSLPGILTKSFSVVITGQRMLPALFAALALVCINKLFLIYYSRRTSVLLTSFFLFVPAFWINAVVTRPDWVGVSMLILSIYFLLIDNSKLRMYYWISLTLFAWVLSVKLHFLMIAPIYLIYTLLCVLYFKRKINLLNLGLTTMGIFLLFNIDMISWSSIMKEFDSFSYQLSQNLPNLEARKVLVTPSMIIDSMAGHYVPSVFLFVLFLSLLVLSVLFLHKQSYVAISSISLGTLIVIFYHLYMVHKTSQYFFLSFILLSLIMFFLLPAFFLNKIALARSRWIVLLLIGVQMIHYSGMYKRIYKDFYMPDQSYVTLLEQTNDSLRDFFRCFNLNPTVILSHGVYFDSNGLDNLRTVHRFTEHDYNRMLRDEYFFLQNYDFVVLYSKSQKRWRSALEDKVAERLIDLGYRVVYANELIMVFGVPEHSL